MTKKITAALAAAALLFSLSACRGDVPAPEIPVTAAEFSEGHANIRLELPEGWVYETVPLNEDRGGIEFRHTDHPDARMGLYYYVRFPGLCGTGVTIEKLEFSSGHAATSYHEELGDVCYTYVIFKDTPGDYAFEAHYVPTEFWNEYGNDILSILDRAVVGAGELSESEALALAEAECPKKYPNSYRTFDAQTGQWTFRFFAVSQYILYTVVVAPDGSILESTPHSYGG